MVKDYELGLRRNCNHENWKELTLTSQILSHARHFLFRHSFLPLMKELAE